MTTPSLRVRLFGVLCLVSSCAIAPSPEDDLLDVEIDAGDPARNVVQDASSAGELDAGISAGDAGGGALDANLPGDASVIAADASLRDASAGDASAGDASAHDGGRDASATPGDAATALDSGGGGSCVPAQCNVTCLTQVCCSALGQCACEDLLGLCILPAL